MTNEERIAANVANGFILVFDAGEWDIWKKKNEVGAWVYYSDRIGGHEGHLPIFDNLCISKEELISIAKDAYGLELK